MNNGTRTALTALMEGAAALMENGSALVARGYFEQAAARLADIGEVEMAGAARQLAVDAGIEAELRGEIEAEEEGE